MSIESAPALTNRLISQSSSSLLLSPNPLQSRPTARSPSLMPYTPRAKSYRAYRMSLPFGHYTQLTFSPILIPPTFSPGP